MDIKNIIGIVSHEEAAKLYKLGFDEPCIGLYDFKSTFLQNSMGSQKECTTFFGGVLAPTNSQVLRWARKQGINPQVYTDPLRLKNWVYHIISFNEEENIDAYSLGEEFPDYEDAEKACITKLLQILETRKKG